MAYPISDVSRRVQYSGSAGAGPYAFTFEVLEQTDIAVYVNSTLKTLTTHYTVTINGDGTGSVTLVTPATGSDTITIVGARAIERTTDFVTGGDLLANSLNDELDSQTIFAQQLLEQVNRTFRLAPYSDLATISTDLPAPSALKAIRWNSDATALENTTYNLDDYTGDAAASAAAASASASAASTSAGNAATSESNAAASAAAATATVGGVDAMGIRWNYSSTTTMADPGAGSMRFNNATVGSITSIAVSATSAATGSPDVSAFVSTWADSTNAIKGHLVIRKATAPGTFAVFTISSVVDNTTWLQVNVAHTDSGGSWTNADLAFVAFTRSGNKGTDGAGSGDFMSDGTVAMTGNLQLAAGVNIVIEGATGDAYETTLTAVDPTADRTVSLPDATGTVALTSDLASYVKLDGTSVMTGSLVFEGATADAYETTLAVTDPTADRTITLPDATGTVILKEATATLTAGYSATPYNAGTKSTGTFTPDEANGNFQYYTNGGAHTLAPPTNNCTLIIQITNNGSAGTITTSGFTKVTGAAPGTTNGDDFLAYVTKINGFSHLAWQALQ